MGNYLGTDKTGNSIVTNAEAVDLWLSTGCILGRGVEARTLLLGGVPILALVLLAVVDYKPSATTATSRAQVPPLFSSGPSHRSEPRS